MVCFMGYNLVWFYSNLIQQNNTKKRRLLFETAPLFNMSVKGTVLLTYLPQRCQGDRPLDTCRVNRDYLTVSLYSEGVIPSYFLNSFEK